MEQTMQTGGAGADAAMAAVLNTYREIPEPKADAGKISALIKSRGRVVGYWLSDGRAVSKEEGVALARAGEIAGVGISVRKGVEYLKALPDRREGNNLGSLPGIPTMWK